jgi:hypothetical protein
MIQFLSITQNPDLTWTFAWASTGAPSYRVVLHGDLLKTTTGLSYTYSRAGFSTYPPPFAH